MPKHPAIARLEAALNTTATVTVRHVRHLSFYRVRAEGFDHVGESTTITVACEALLRNNGLDGYPDIYA